MTTAEILKFVLLAFGAGVILPLAVQLFITLRATHRTLVVTGRRLEQTLESLESAALHAQQSVSPTTRTMTAIGAALVPAVAAAVRSWQAQGVSAGAETAKAERAIDSQRGGEDPEASTSKEIGHARA
jgi:HAMP domain-containing protein